MVAGLGRPEEGLTLFVEGPEVSEVAGDVALVVDGGGEDETVINLREELEGVARGRVGFTCARERTDGDGGQNTSQN